MCEVEERTKTKEDQKEQLVSNTHKLSANVCLKTPTMEKIIQFSVPDVGDDGHCYVAVDDGRVFQVRIPDHIATGQVLAASIYRQVTQTLDWNFAAAQAVILFAGVALVLIPYIALMRRPSHG